MILRLLAALASLAAAGLAEPPATESVRKVLQHEPFSAGELTPYIKSPTPEIRDMIWAEFRRTSDAAPEGRRKKQDLANVLCRIKSDDGTASAYLAKLAEEAASTTAPMALALDENRKVTGKVSPEFEAWAAAQHLDASKALVLELDTHPRDILLLSYRVDPKYNDIFRRGLGSNNLVVAAGCALALARLGDISSIKWIRTASERTASIPEANEAWALALFSFKGDDAANEVRRQFAGTAVLPIYERLASNKRSSRRQKP